MALLTLVTSSHSFIEKKYCRITWPVQAAFLLSCFSFVESSSSMLNPLSLKAQPRCTLRTADMVRKYRHTSSSVTLSQPERSRTHPKPSNGNGTHSSLIIATTGAKKKKNKYRSVTASCVVNRIFSNQIASAAVLPRVNRQTAQLFPQMVDWPRTEFENTSPTATPEKHRRHRAELETAKAETTKRRLVLWKRRKQQGRDAQ